MWHFFWRLIWDAASLTTHDSFSSSWYALLTDLLVIVFILIAAFRTDGAMKKLLEVLRNGGVVIFVMWMLAFLYNSFIAVPEKIRLEASMQNVPGVPNLSPPGFWAHLAPPPLARKLIHIWGVTSTQQKSLNAALRKISPSIPCHVSFTYFNNHDAMQFAQQLYDVFGAASWKDISLTASPIPTPPAPGSGADCIFNKKNPVGILLASLFQQTWEWTDLKVYLHDDDVGGPMFRSSQSSGFEIAGRCNFYSRPQSNAAPVIVQQAPAVSGNLKERTLVFADEIADFYYQYGWKEQPGTQSHRMGHMPTDDPAGMKAWKQSRSSLFHYKYWKKIHDIRDEFASLHHRDNRLDEIIEMNDLDKNETWFDPREAGELADRLRALAGEL